MTVTVELVGARGCCLCEEAKAVLEQHRERLGYRLAEVDITGDDALERAYREHIPVVFVNGERAFVYRVEPAALARAVAAARAADTPLPATRAVEPATDRRTSGHGAGAGEESARRG